MSVVLLGDDSHQKHFVMSSIEPILNCSDRIIQQNQGFVWGSRLPRLQNLTSVNTSNLRLSLEPYFVLKDDGKVYESQWTKPEGFLSLRLIICRCFFLLVFFCCSFFPISSMQLQLYRSKAKIPGWTWTQAFSSDRTQPFGRWAISFSFYQFSSCHPYLLQVCFAGVFFLTSVLRFGIKGLESRTKQLIFYQNQCSDVHHPLFSAVIN